MCVWGGGVIIYLSLHCHHQNNSCIKMGSDESHFKVSLIVRNKVTRQCPQTTTFEVKGEPKQIRTEVPLPAKPAHQTDSRLNWPLSPHGGQWRNQIEWAVITTTGRGMAVRSAASLR